ncbi:MAG: hypothetical protein V4508_03385 [Pseudomonadota bacterium]
MKHTALLVLALAAGAPALADEKTAPPAPPLKEASVTFLDSKLFDNMLSKELSSDKDTVEVNITGRMTLNNIPGRVDAWITAVGESGELTLKPSDPALKPKFILGLIPIVYSFIKQSSAERNLDPVKKYNASIIYHIDKAGESVIDRIVFVRKK